ncbi:MAG: M23 family metallopeptidase [Leptospirales bacterium]
MKRNPLKNKKKRGQSEGVTMMVIPHSQKHVMRVRLNYRLIYFLVLFIGLTGIFSIVTVAIARKTTTVKTTETENFRIWEDKILALENGINRVYSHLSLLKEFGQRYHDHIWGDDYITGGDGGYGDSISQNVAYSARELGPTLDFLLEREKALRSLPMGWPIDTGYITSEFGGRISPFGLSEDFHTGYDFAYPIGTPIKATADGKVIFSGGGTSGYGFYVVILHDHGFVTVYAHADSVIAEKDEFVKRGDVIALLGRSGSATGPHVHYEVRLQYPGQDRPYEIFLNPLPFIKREY